MKKLIVLFAILLTACGGSLSDLTKGNPVTITSYPLQSGYKARLAAGSSDNYTMNMTIQQGSLVTCTGTANVTTTVPASTTFQTFPAFKVTETDTITMNDCGINGVSIFGFQTTIYLDTNYNVWAFDVSGSQFSQDSVPPTMPTSVKVGDSGTFLTMTSYADATKSVVTGSTQVTYSVATETNTTALVTLIETSKDTSNVITGTTKTVYRIEADGKLTALSYELQTTGTNAMHVTLTK